jgi:ABC-type Zn2+ transport system substrate-binding protein/surface adhesin
MNTPRCQRLFAAAALAVGIGAAPALAEIKVAATIKPVHSLVAAVMGDVGEPALLLDGPASPHVTALRPSQAQIIEDSDVVFAVGEGLEAFLHGLMESGAGTRIVELAEAPGIELLDYRENDHAGGHDDHAHEATTTPTRRRPRPRRRRPRPRWRRPRPRRRRPCSTTATPMQHDGHAHAADGHAHAADDHAHDGDDPAAGDTSCPRA